MTDRSYRRGRNDRRHDTPYSRQPEQFESDRSWRDDEYRQMGESSYYSDRDDYGQPDTGGYSSGRNASRPSGRDAWLHDEAEGSGSYDRRRQPGHFAASSYRDYDPTGFASFTSNDYGGRDFSGISRDRGGRPYTGSGSQSHGYSSPRSARRDYDQGDRGWLDRAGDEIASWFGDEDAARRREQDHSGRGPSGYVRSDERILEDVSDELTRDWQVDATNITVSVLGGDVTLDGTVPSRTHKRRAEDVTEDVSGVKNVQNNLRVREESAWDRNNSGSTAVGRGSTE